VDLTHASSPFITSIYHRLHAVEKPCSSLTPTMWMLFLTIISPCARFLQKWLCSLWSLRSEPNLNAFVCTGIHENAIDSQPHIAAIHGKVFCRDGHLIFSCISSFFKMTVIFFYFLHYIRVFDCGSKLHSYL